MRVAGEMLADSAEIPRKGARGAAGPLAMLSLQASVYGYGWHRARGFEVAAPQRAPRPCAFVQPSAGTRHERSSGSHGDEPSQHARLHDTSAGNLGGIGGGRGTRTGTPAPPGEEAGGRQLAFVARFAASASIARGEGEAVLTGALHRRPGSTRNRDQKGKGLPRRRILYSNCLRNSPSSARTAAISSRSCATASRSASRSAAPFALEPRPVGGTALIARALSPDSRWA